MKEYPQNQRKIRENPEKKICLQKWLFSFQQKYEATKWRKDSLCNKCVGTFGHPYANSKPWYIFLRIKIKNQSYA